jgi:glycosyltransferase involved in cell wall biosynthesis
MISLTALIITRNEAPNLRRTLEKLAWVPKIIVLDSGSTDETLAIAAEFPQVSVATRPFDSFAQQCNHGLSLITTEWALSMDADYVLTDELAAEIQRLEPGSGIAGYKAAFIYCVHGKPLRSTLYPARAALYRAALARYADDGHGHKVSIKGEVAELNNKIFHDDRKPLARWLASQHKYAAQEADKLLSALPTELGRADKLRLRIWPAAPAVLVYTLLWQRLILDGWPGIYYALQRAYAELLLSLELLDRKLSNRKST